MCVRICNGQSNFIVYSEISWWNPADSEFNVIAGQAWSGEVESIYHRFPSRAKESVKKGVWNLSRQSAGPSIRFWSNFDTINIKYKLKGFIAFPHMPATGVSGVDFIVNRMMENGSDAGETIQSRKRALVFL